MKLIILFFIICSGWLSAGEIIWQKDLFKAISLAQTEKRPLIVMVEGTHCRWCKKMRYRTLSDERVIAKMASFVNVRVDQEDTKAAALLPKIEGVPTIFFLSSDQKVLETAMGYYDVNDFLSFFISFESKRKQLSQME